jgi:MFS family permease
MSGMTMIQGSVAADLDAYDLTTWFTTSYLFATSAAPLFGKLATIFPPKALVLPSALFLALGSLVVAFSRSFAVFIVGRLLMGTGCAGVMTLTIILILDLTDRRRRGFFIGLVNASFTFGVSFGAVVYGALLPAIGWVSSVPLEALRLCLHELTDIHITATNVLDAIPHRPGWRHWIVPQHPNTAAAA